MRKMNLNKVNGECLVSTPSTSTGTGFRWYTHSDNGQPMLVCHTNGTPSTSSTTTAYTPQEVRAQFSWEWDHVPAFEPVKNWIEAHE